MMRQAITLLMAIARCAAGAEGEMFDPTARLQHPKVVLDPPALEIEGDDFPGSIETVRQAGQQVPLHRFLALRRFGFDDVHR